MHCFNHELHNAAGICKHCQKALCINCIDFAGECVVCKTAACKQETERSLMIIDFSDSIRKSYGNSWKNSVGFSRLLTIVGVAFLLTGIWGILQAYNSYVDYLMVVIGLIFIAPSAYTSLYDRKIPKE